MHTVGSLIERGVRVLAKCQECGSGTTANLAAIAEAKGLDYDLTDKTPPCRTPDCGYWVALYASDGMAMKQLSTPWGDAEVSNRRTVWIRENGPRRYALKVAQKRKSPPPR